MALSEFEKTCEKVLNRAFMAWQSDYDSGEPPPTGARSQIYYRDIPDAMVALVHFIERGFIEYVNPIGIRQFVITRSGIEEYRRVKANPDPAETLRAEIAALERQLADKRAALGAVETGENSVM